ncbi:hypothetical protein BFJ67_g17789 [Fusarium oxysporum f. sp. cepae]|nr:hypothetical protein BFJ67_g17789 [Fusarium oxysporum f. sp. cepae]
MLTYPALVASSQLSLSSKLADQADVTAAVGAGHTSHKLFMV